jgi:hypothetical protein
MFYYFFIFILIILLCFLIKNRKGKLLSFIFLGTLLFFFAAFRGPNVDRDYQGYIEYYNDVINQSFLGVEPTFSFISHLVNTISNNNLYLFVIYALFGVLIKFYAIKKLTHLWLFSALIYFCNFFLLHEMTQIRIGVASGLLLLSIVPIQERQTGKFLILMLLAVSFHYSAIVGLPLYFINGNKFNIKIYSILIPFAYLVYFMNFNLFSLIGEASIPIHLIQIKYASYSSANIEFGETINPFNYVYLSRCLLSYFFIFSWRHLTKDSVYNVILLKIYIISMFFFIAFGRTPAVSSRVSEFLMVVEIILIPFLINVFKNKIVSSLCVTGIGFIFLLFSLFYTKLLSSYTIRFF